VLWIFSVLKNPSPSAGFEPTNFGSNGNHAKHYTTDEDKGDVMWHSSPFPHITEASTHKVMFSMETNWKI
jgi:hypothetical protein